MLDRTRMVIERRLGTDPVDPNSYFQEGMILQWGAAGWARSLDGTVDVLRGIAGVNKISALTFVVVKEAVSFAAGDTQNLKKGNIAAGSARVTDVAGVTLYAEPGDYSIDTTHGTITRNDGAIASGATVLVSFTYQRTMEEAEQEVGFPVSNNLDETFGSGGVVVFQGDCRITTDQYDTSKAYNINDPVYDNGDGLLTNDPGSEPPFKVCMGKVQKAPTAADPMITVELDSEICSGYPTPTP